MKKIILLTSTIIFALCFTNCKEKKYFKEIVSEKKVSITKIRFAKKGEDLVVTIPIEFALYLNNFPNILRVGIYYKKDNRLCSDFDDYLIYNSKTDEIIFSLDKIPIP